MSLFHAARRRPGGAPARLAAVVAVAAALVVAPGGTWRAPVAAAATPTAFTDVPATATVGAPYAFTGTV
ncbi:hypothetical protein ACFV4N_43590, partial [Actinosynnema sp. NPDC059797]